VLHINDCAFTAANLVHEASARGLPWDMTPLAASGQTWSGPVAKERRAGLGAAWLARLAARAARVDLLHVHFATVYQHTRLVPRRFVLHCHGSDVRTLQYDARYTATIHRALANAAAVFYSTPDLAEHTLPHRPDAVYIPVPIDTAALPGWAPTTDTPQVLFSSRWDDSKGLAAQLAIAEGLVEATKGTDAEVVGLDWGPAAAAAREAGVRLLPRRDHTEYLRLLATAHVVVGQSSGILAASELEALGIGAPLLMTADHALYGDATPPVLDASTTSPDDVVQAAVQAVTDPAATAQSQRGPAWVEEHHGSGHAVDRALGVYRSLS
jgi:glycosyltransferase involved in cell wall biosynthesis